MIQIYQELVALIYKFLNVIIKIYQPFRKTLEHSVGQWWKLTRIKFLYFNSYFLNFHKSQWIFN